MNPAAFAHAHRLDVSLDMRRQRTLGFEFSNDQDTILLVTPLDFPGMGKARVGLQMSLHHAQELRAQLDQAIAKSQQHTINQGQPR